MVWVKMLLLVTQQVERIYYIFLKFLFQFMSSFVNSWKQLISWQIFENNLFWHDDTKAYFASGRLINFFGQNFCDGEINKYCTSWCMAKKQTINYDLPFLAEWNVKVVTPAELRWESTVCERTTASWSRLTVSSPNWTCVLFKRKIWGPGWLSGARSASF